MPRRELPLRIFHPPFYCLPLVVSEVEPLGDSEPSRTVSTMSSTPHFVLSLSVEGRSFRLEESLSNGRTIKGGKKAVIGRMHSKLGPPEGREVSCSSRTPSSVMRFGNGQGVRYPRSVKKVVLGVRKLVGTKWKSRLAGLPRFSWISPVVKHGAACLTYPLHLSV